MVVLKNFAQLESRDFFRDLVRDHFGNGWQHVSAAGGSSVLLDDALIGLAFDGYSLNIEQYRVALKSANPDHFKRAGALLHALYTAPPIVEVRWSEETKRLCNVDAVGVSVGDAEFWNKYTEWYEDNCNRLISFDLAFRCCQIYE
jgi:hypothetical protein